MPTNDMFSQSGFAERGRCCAARLNNHRCPNASTAAGDYLICDDHLRMLRGGAWIRLYKQSEFITTALGQAFARLRASNSPELASADGKSVLSPDAGGADGKSSSWFAKLLSPEGVGMILFIFTVYSAETLKLGNIGAPKSLTLSGAETLSFAVGNAFSALGFVALGVIWVCVFVVIVACVLVALRRLYEILKYLGLKTVPGLMLHATMQTRLLLMLFCGRLVSRLPASYRPASFDWLSGDGALYERVKVAMVLMNEKFEVRGQSLSDSDLTWRQNARDALKAAIKWYHDKLAYREKNRPAVNWVQATSLAALFSITLGSTWFGADQFNKRLNRGACKSVPELRIDVKRLSSWLNLVPASYDMLNRLVHAVDCGYLIFDKRRENIASLLVSGATEELSATPQVLFSEKVAYLGDYGEWSLVVPAARPEQRVLVRRSFIQEFSHAAPVNGLWRTPAETDLEDRLTQQAHALHALDLEVDGMQSALARHIDISATRGALAQVARDLEALRVLKFEPFGSALATLKDDVARLNRQTVDVVRRPELLQKVEAQQTALGTYLWDRETRLRDDIARLNVKVEAFQHLADDRKFSDPGRPDLAPVTQVLTGINAGLVDLNTALRARASSDLEHNSDEHPKKLGPEASDGTRTGTQAGRRISDTHPFGFAAAILPTRAASIFDTSRNRLRRDDMRACLNSHAEHSEFVVFEHGRTTADAASVVASLAPIEERLALDRRAASHVGGRAFVFFRGGASTRGSQTYNRHLSEMRAEWVESVWARHLLSQSGSTVRHLHEIGIELIAFGGGERLPAHKGALRKSPRSVEVFVCFEPSKEAVQ